MIQYDNRYDHDGSYEQDPIEDLMYIWRCNKCGHEREDYPGYNEGGSCDCGGWYSKVGESYPA